MAQFILKRGNLANLSSLAIQDGQFIVVKDERSIYVDVGSERIRLGDFQEFASIEALNSNVNPSTTALYYVSDVNVLAKWDGIKYVQINTDTGATSVEVVGEGNAVTAASYNAVTRKLTLTKGVSFATKAEHDTLAEKVNALEVTGGQANVIESVKVNGVALEVADDKSVNVVVPTGALASKDIVEKSDLAEGVQASLDKADSALQSHQDISHLAVKTEVETALSGKVDKEEGKSLIADSEIARLLTLANYDDTQVKADIKANADAIDAIEADYVKSADIANFETKANVKKVADDLAAYVTSNDTALTGVKATAEAATTVAEVDAQIDAKVAALNLATTYEPIGAETRAKAYADGLISDANLDQYTTKQEVKDIVDAVVAGAVEGDTLTGLANLVEYINTHGSEAAEMASAIDTLEGKVETIEGKPAYGITATQISNWDNEVGAKAAAESALNTYKGEVTTALAGKVDKVEGKSLISDTEIARLADVHNYDDTALAGRVSVLEAIDHDAYKAYADQAEADAIAAAASDAASKYETIGTAQGIVDGLDLANTYEAKGEAAKVQSNLTAYQTANDAAVAAVKATAEAAYVKPETGIAKSDLAADVQTSLGKADTALQEHQDISHLAVAANVYAKSETYSKTEVDTAISNAALTWDEF